MESSQIWRFHLRKKLNQNIPKAWEDLPSCLISLRRWNCGVSIISTHSGWTSMCPWMLSLNTCQHTKIQQWVFYVSFPSWSHPYPMQLASFADQYHAHSRFGEEEEHRSSQYLSPSRAEWFEASPAATQISLSKQSGLRISLHQLLKKYMHKEECIYW